MSIRPSTSNDFESCYLRHSYLKKVTHRPSKEQMSPYDPLIRKFAHKMQHHNKKLLESVGFMQEDLQSIAKVHLITFLGLFSLERNENAYDRYIDVFLDYNKRMPTEKDLLDYNKAVFTKFLKQRAEDMIRICTQKVRNIRGTLLEKFVVLKGKNSPPEDLKLLLLNPKKFGYRAILANTFKERRIKLEKNGQKPPIYFLNGFYYVYLPAQNKTLSAEDLSCSVLGTHDNIYGMTADLILEKADLDQKISRFENLAAKKKLNILRNFVVKHQGLPDYVIEISAARKMIKNVLKGQNDIG